MFDADVIELLASEEGEMAQGENSRDRCEALEACMGDLTPKCREVVELRYGEEMAGHEVAARLGRKPDTIYKMLARSYAQLRECIERRLSNRRPSGEGASA